MPRRASRPQRLVARDVRTNDRHELDFPRCVGADDHSDVDLLIIEPTVSNRYEEMIRLNRALRGMLMPVDLLVVSEQEFEQRSATPGTVEHTARREGQVLYAA